MIEPRLFSNAKRRSPWRPSWLGLIGLVAMVLACAPAAPSPTVAPAKPAASPAAKPAAKGPIEVVKRGNLRGITFQSTIAQALGYYAEVGIDDQEVVFGSGAEMGQAAAAGEVDVIATSNNAAFFNVIGRGLKQLMVSDNWHLERGDRSYMVVLRPDLAGTVKQLKDLKGMRNVSSTPLRDGGHWAIGDKMFKAAGMQLEDVQWERLGFPDMLPALANKSVDAAWMIEPFITLGKQQNFLVPWLNLGDEGPGTQIAGMVFSERMIKERTDVGRRWMVATVRAHRDFNDFLRGKKRDVIGPILAKHTGVAPALIEQVGWGPLHPDGRVNIESLLESQRLHHEWGKIQQVLPADQLVDNQFVDYALQQLGPYQP